MKNTEILILLKNEILKQNENCTFINFSVLRLTTNQLDLQSISIFKNIYLSS